MTIFVTIHEVITHMLAMYNEWYPILPCTMRLDVADVRSPRPATPLSAIQV